MKRHTDHQLRHISGSIDDISDRGSQHSFVDTLHGRNMFGPFAMCMPFSTGNPALQHMHQQRQQQSYFYSPLAPFPPFVSLSLSPGDVRPQERKSSLSHPSICSECQQHSCPPLKAAAIGHFDCLLWLHQDGKVVDIKDKTGATPLHAAVGNGHLECAMWLVERTGADLYARDGSGSMPVHHAAYHGRLACLKWLIIETRGIATHATSLNGGTPVHFAAAKGNILCLQWLCSEQ
eukprot:gene7030-9609_t